MTGTRIGSSNASTLRILMCVCARIFNLKSEVRQVILLFKTANSRLEAVKRLTKTTKGASHKLADELRSQSLVLLLENESEKL